MLNSIGSYIDSEDGQRITVMLEESRDGKIQLRVTNSNEVSIIFPMHPHLTAGWIRILAESLNIPAEDTETLLSRVV